MDETQAFLDDVMPRQLEAERAMHDGSATLRQKMWSQREPLTLLGADLARVTGVQEVHQAFETVASWFSGCSSYDIELIAAGASGDLAYTVVLEHTRATLRGVESEYTLRVTHAYRREDGQWRVVHRHADAPPTVAGSFAGG